MVGFSFSNSAKPINSKWQQFRRNAEQTALSITEFSDIEIVKYDLENLKFGRYVDSTYIIDDRPLKEEVEKDSYDLRELDNR